MESIAGQWPAASGNSPQAATSRISGIPEDGGSAPPLPDIEQIRTYYDVLFRYVDSGFIAVRAFHHGDDSKPPLFTRWADFGLGVDKLARVMLQAAKDAARAPDGAVLAPPVCTFASMANAAKANVELGPVLVVEADDNAADTVRRLEGLLGPATLLVASGGTTKAGEPKLHAYWRLTEPTSSPEDHAKGERCRRIMALLTGADLSAVPLPHPMRVPGSLHTKDPSRPRLCRIVGGNHEAEVELVAALEALEHAAWLAGIEVDDGNRATSSNATVAPEGDLGAYAATIPNEVADWHGWNRIGMTFFAASGGSDAGLAAFTAWSAKLPEVHDERACLARWRHYPTSPPTSLTAGTLFHLAREADPDFRLPSWDAPPDAAVLATAAALTGKAVEPAPELPPLVELSREEATARLREAVADGFTRALNGDPDKPLQLAIKGAAGLGKTAIIKDEINARPGIRVGAYTSTVRLGEDWTAGLGDPALIRGRSQEVDGKPLCPKHEEAVAVASAGFNVASTLCKRGTGPDTEHCEFFRTCRYLRQLASRATVRVHAHEYAWLPPPPATLVGKIPKPDLIIIDEGFALAAARKTDIPLDRLTADNPFLAAVEGNSTGALGRRLRDALEAGRDLRAEFTAEEVDVAIAAAAAALSRPAPVTPGMKQAEQRRLLKGLGRSLAARLYRLWTVLGEDLATGRKVQRVRLVRNVPQPGGAEPRDVVRVNWRRPLKLPAGVPILLLDASLDPDIARLWFPHLEVVEIPAHRNATVVQVASTTCSKNRLLSYDSAPDAAKATAANRLADVKAMAMAEARKGRKVAVTTYKEARGRMGEVPGVDTLHFGAVRGLDHLKHHDVMFVAGRNQPPPAEVEDIALSLFGDRHELTLTGAYVTRPRAYRMRDGSRPVVGVAEHEDPFVNRVLEQVREQESLQVLDRLRLIHRTKPATVYLLSNLPLPGLYVDQLVRWNDLVPSRRQQMADRHNGAVPLSPTEMHRLCPDLWPTAAAAEKARQRAGIAGQNPIRVSQWEMSGNSLAVYRRPGQRGRPLTVLLPGSVATPAAAEAFLQAAGFGPVTVLRVGSADMLDADQSAAAPAEAVQESTSSPPPEEGPNVPSSPEPLRPAAPVVAVFDGSAYPVRRPSPVEPVASAATPPVIGAPRWAMATLVALLRPDGTTAHVWTEGSLTDLDVAAAKLRRAGHHGTPLAFVERRDPWTPPAPREGLQPGEAAA